MRNTITPARLALAWACLATAGLAQVACSPAAVAQTSHAEEVWTSFNVSGPVADGIVYLAEVQPRFAGLSSLDELLLRGAIGVELSSAVKLHQGYARVVSPVAGGRDTREHRSFQQLDVALSKSGQSELTARTRLEQRWRNDGNDTGWRLRQMARYETPLQSGDDPIKALISAEAFFALNDTDWGSNAGVDQVRGFVGAELPLAGTSTAEIGYMNQTINQSGGRTQMNHIASISLFFRH